MIDRQIYIYIFILLICLKDYSCFFLYFMLIIQNKEIFNKLNESGLGVKLLK